MNHCFGLTSTFVLEVDPIHDCFCPMRLWLDSEPVWAYEDGGPVAVSCISFLYHLAVYWNEVFTNESYPDSYQKIVSSENPERAIASLLDKITSSATPDSTTQEERLMIFEQAHNMVLWDDEVFCRTDVYLFRLDSELQISSEGKTVSCPLHKIQAHFVALGDFLCEQICRFAPDSHAISAWRRREEFKTIF